MAVVSMVVGATSPSGATFVARVDGLGPVRVQVANNPDMTGAVFTSSQAVDAQGVAKVSINGLDANTRYWWRTEDNSVIDTTIQGQFLTHPPLGEPSDITIGWASCAGGEPETPGLGTEGELAPSRLSNHQVFDTVRQRALAEDWLFFGQLGDICYYDLGSNNHGIVGGGSLANFRALYDDVLAQPRQHQLYREVSWLHDWDDHDFDGNDSDGTFVDKTNGQQVYRERVPHHPLVDGGAIFHSFSIGTILFIAADVRSFRDPNTDPQGPSKTMLGTAQKDWMASLLGSAPEQFLVWMMPSQWHPPAGASDTWDSFQDERTELINMFRDLGWIDRMCIISGDVHALAMDTGTNSPGGIPVFQAAAMDSIGTGASHTQYDLGVSAGNNQYGRLRLVDDGDTVTVTVTGFIGDAVWQSHAFVIGEEPPPPPPSPEVLQIVQARIRNEVTWLACNLQDGRIIQELPDIRGRVSRIIGEYTTHELQLPIPTVGGRIALDGTEPSLFQRARLVRSLTTPPRVMLVAVVNDIPTWAGIVLRPRGGTPAMMKLSVPSIESYLLHRFVRDHTWADQDIGSVIAAGLLADAEASISGQGAGIGLIIDAPPTGILADRTYHATDHASVYEQLSELMEVLNGVEWTVDLDWADERMNAVVKIARVRRRLGIAATSPSAVFQISANSVFGSVGAADTIYELDRDFGDGRYANVTQAYSSGEGEDQPVSQFAIDATALATGTPIWEDHFQPSTSISSQSVLDDHAIARLERLRHGAHTWKINARWDAFPRYGVHWRLGDDVAFSLTGHLHPPDVEGRDGILGVGRAIGFNLDIAKGRIEPILLDPLSQGGSL